MTFDFIGGVIETSSSLSFRIGTGSEIRDWRIPDDMAEMSSAPIIWADGSHLNSFYGLAEPRAMLLIYESFYLSVLSFMRYEQ